MQLHKVLFAKKKKKKKLQGFKKGFIIIIRLQEGWVRNGTMLEMDLLIKGWVQVRIWHKTCYMVLDQVPDLVSTLPLVPDPKTVDS